MQCSAVIGGTPDFLAPQEVEDDDDITSSDEAPDLDDDGGFCRCSTLGIVSPVG